MYSNRIVRSWDRVSRSQGPQMVRRRILGPSRPARRVPPVGLGLDAVAGSGVVRVPVSHGLAPSCIQGNCYWIPCNRPS